MDKSAKVSAVVDLDLLIDFGYGAHLRYKEILRWAPYPKLFGVS